MDGEGCFYVKPISSRKGFAINVSISQHIRDEFLLTKIANFFNCGIIERPTTRSHASFVVYKFDDILEKIIPFFQKYPLQGVKSLDFEDFVKVAYILKNNVYLTEKDLDLILSIKMNMNKKRIL